MKICFDITYFQLYNYITGKYDSKWDPRGIYFSVQEKYVDPPDNFTVSLGLHSNYSQVVSTSWTPSTDTDVSGYEIYRRRYYLIGTTVTATDYALVATIPSRTTSSWQDSPVWGTHSNQAIGYCYEIRSVSNILGKKSFFVGGQKFSPVGFKRFPHLIFTFSVCKVT